MSQTLEMLALALLLASQPQTYELRENALARFASWSTEDTAPPVPLNYVGIVVSPRVDDFALARAGSSSGPIPVDEELAPGAWSFDPGRAAPLNPGENLAVVMSCAGCDAQFERTIGDFVDNDAPVIAEASNELDVVRDEHERIQFDVTIDDNSSPTVALVLGADNFERRFVAADVPVGVSSPVSVVVDSATPREYCFRLTAVDWAGNRSTQSGRACAPLEGGCASTTLSSCAGGPFALLALMLFFRTSRRARARGRSSGRLSRARAAEARSASRA